MLKYKTLIFEASGAGLEQFFTVPENIGSIWFQVVNGIVKRRNVTGSVADGWTILKELPQGFDFQGLGGEVIYFTGNEGAILEINWIEGLLS